VVIDVVKTRNTVLHAEINFSFHGFMYKDCLQHNQENFKYTLENTHESS
jgi:thiamine pyrophosphokinase